MDIITFQSSGSFNHMESFLRSIARLNLHGILDSAGRDGVLALASAVPQDSGLAAESWDYIVERSKRGASITWTNTDVENGFPVAIMLQYGYGTGTGGYVQGRDYINPAIKPIFDRISDTVWKAVTSA